MKEQANVILNYYNEFNFFQFNKIVNYNHEMLDLVFTTLRHLIVNQSTEPLLECDPYHPALILNFSLCMRTAPVRVAEWRRDFYRANYEAINNYLGSILWDKTLLDLEVNEAVELIYYHLNFAVSNYVPINKLRALTYPKWFSKELISLTKGKKAAHRKYKTTNLYSDYLSFMRFRSRCKSLSEKCWRDYACNSEININNNANNFWQFVKSLKSSKCPPTQIQQTVEGSISYIEDENAIANCFADYFETTYSNDSIQMKNLNYSHVLDISSLEITIDEVFNCLNSLRKSSAPGIDGFPTIFYHSCNYIMTRVLWLIYNKSLSCGVFPSAWRALLVTPIFKGGDRMLTSNYRPICKQNVMAKIFESIIASKLTILSKNVIIKEQHGFATGRSTTTNLLVYHDFINTSIESGSPVDTIYTDFRKAFDSVSHSLLIDKLQILGISGTFLKWLGDFVMHRSQVVKFKNGFSRVINVTSGVPQGSHLGPLLFNLFINDIGRVFENSSFLLYADDLKIYKRVNNSVDAMLLQQDLNKLFSWCKSNGMQFNLSKCHVMHFTRRRDRPVYNYSIGGERLSEVDSFRDLGVIFSSNLTFDTHIRSASARASRQLGFVLRSSKHFKSVQTLKILYCALVRPLLEYCSPLWAPYQRNQCSMLERIQHHFLRRASAHMNKPMKIQDHCYTSILQELNLVSLENRRAFIDMLLLFRIVNGLVDCSDLLSCIKFHIPMRSLRGNAFFHEETHRTSYGKFKPLNRMCSMANTLPDKIDFFNMSSMQFKKALHYCLNGVTITLMA